MSFLSHCLMSDLQWQTYQQLELIPAEIANPSVTSPRFVFGLDVVWRTLILLLLDELITEQQVEYLDRCWHSSQLADRHKPAIECLQKLWVLMS